MSAYSGSPDRGSEEPGGDRTDTSSRYSRLSSSNSSDPGSRSRSRRSSLRSTGRHSPTGRIEEDQPKRLLNDDDHDISHEFSSSVSEPSVDFADYYPPPPPDRHPAAGLTEEQNVVAYLVEQRAAHQAVLNERFDTYTAKRADFVPPPPKLSQSVYFQPPLVARRLVQREMIGYRQRIAKTAESQRQRTELNDLRIMEQLNQQDRAAGEAKQRPWHPSPRLLRPLESRKKAEEASQRKQPARPKSARGTCAKACSRLYSQSQRSRPATARKKGPTQEPIKIPLNTFNQRFYTQQCTEKEQVAHKLERKYLKASAAKKELEKKEEDVDVRVSVERLAVQDVKRREVLHENKLKKLIPKPPENPKKVKSAALASRMYDEGVAHQKETIRKLADRLFHESDKKNIHHQARPLSADRMRDMADRLSIPSPRYLTPDGDEHM